MHTEGRWYEDTGRRQNVIRMMHLQAKEYQGVTGKHHQLEEAEIPQREHGPADTLIPDFQPPELLRQYISVV